jgi:SH3-like domain-containing protein
LAGLRIIQPCEASLEAVENNVTGEERGGMSRRRYALHSMRVRAVAAVAAIMLAPSLSGLASARPPGAIGPETGLPLPRFVSVKPKRALVRAGPGFDYPAQWTYVRRGIPLEVIAEYDNWRKIRDWEASVGWMHSALLSPVRMVLTEPRQAGTRLALRAEPDPRARTVAMVEPNVLLRIKHCAMRWCRVTVRRHFGFVRKERLWGVYPDETIRSGTFF